VGDTYFDLKAFGKGYLWVNGHLLGRYWDIGPQERLFCPGVWLKEGKNEVKVLELSQSIHLKLSSKEFLRD
jgi:beta-galactosidase